MANRNNQFLKCFLSIPYSPKYRKIKETVVRGIRKARYELIDIEDQYLPSRNIIRDVLYASIAQADYVIADISESNLNVIYELGIAQAMGKGTLIIAKEKSLWREQIPMDLQGLRIITYSDSRAGLETLVKTIVSNLNIFRDFPSRNLISPPTGTPPFFVEWGRLNHREVENLTRELLSQMGFRNLDWYKESKELDLVAELPKKDPDGFEYRDFWFISIGLRSSKSDLIENLIHDPKYFFGRILRNFRGIQEQVLKQKESSITILIMNLKSGPGEKEFQRLQRRLFEDRFYMDGFSFRLRVWDKNYLTSLVQKYPQIGYKYFSEEGRIRSEVRKTYEELYHDYSNLSSRQSILIKNLEKEKNKRIRAERDSVWKDISFTAAHKIGNPIFAIETDLEPLLKRIKEDRKIESYEVIDNMRSAVEKAKRIIEQFKSLTKAQRIEPFESLILRDILENICKSLTTQEVDCNIRCSKKIRIHGNFEKLTECFDELVANSLHWFDKTKKQIRISVKSIPDHNLPEYLDKSEKYVKVTYKDNGSGIICLCNLSFG